MDERIGSTGPLNSDRMQRGDAMDERARTAGYRRESRHIPQEPITDPGAEYASHGFPRPARATGPSRPTRRHMGVATNDPTYLPDTPLSGEGVRRGPAHPVPEPGERRSLHYDRYLERPKPGKSIFTRREQAQRKRTRILVLLAVLIVAIVLLVWFLVLG